MEEAMKEAMEEAMEIGRRPRLARQAVALVAAVLAVVLAAGSPAMAASATLSASRDVTWTTSGGTATMRATVNLTVVDNGPSGYFTGNLTGRTFNFTNLRICSRGEIILRASIRTATSLRPELNNGWDLVDVRVVAPTVNDFVYRKAICNSNSTAAGFGYSSSNPLRWSSSPWMVTSVRATLTTWNLTSSGAVFRSVSASAGAAV
jgi:hypothetical protein